MNALLDLTFRGNPLVGSVSDAGELRRSDDLSHDPVSLHARMAEDGYLYLPGLLDPEETLAARLGVMKRLARLGSVDETRPLLDGKYKPGGGLGTMFDFTLDNPALMKVLYDGPMIRFYERFLGGPVTHFDYTWFRVKVPGAASPTQPHYDVVYMGRGTPNLYSSWTPLGDVPFEMGGLIILENSHKSERLRHTYARTDVDKYCENENQARRIVETARVQARDLTGEEQSRIRWNSTGSFAPDAIQARNDLGGRWLTADYKLGDVLVFSMRTLHASSDNHTDRIRISSDSRYQLASEPQDERWIGTRPPAHGIRAKQGMIC
jgi:hypothetical protein